MALIDKEKQVVFGKYYSYWMENSPRRFLNHLSYYKFAADLIGKGKRVLDIGCNEGMGTRLLSVECGFAKGVDFDAHAIEKAQQSWADENTEFVCDDIYNYKPGNWNAVTSFDVIEHIHPENIKKWWRCIVDNLQHDGIVILGTPSITSKQYASMVTNMGHVNLYSADRLKEEMLAYFKHVFIFSANDELIHTGFKPLAHYYIAIGCQRIL